MNTGGEENKTRLKEGRLPGKHTLHRFSTTAAVERTNLLSILRQEGKSLHTLAEELLLQLAQGQLGGRFKLLGVLVVRCLGGKVNEH